LGFKSHQAVSLAKTGGFFLADALKERTLAVLAVIDPWQWWPRCGASGLRASDCTEARMVLPVGQQE
jgi:hypothetical protein